MSYQINILRQGQKVLRDLQQEDYERVRNSILTLAQEPRPNGCLKLSGGDGWRIPVGKYRVI